MTQSMPIHTWELVDEIKANSEWGEVPIEQTHRMRLPHGGWLYRYRWALPGETWAFTMAYAPD